MFKGLVLHLDAINSMQIIFGLYERETYAYLRKLSAGIESAVDIGAAEGEFSIYFRKTAGAKKVLAFEPHPENRDTFQTNLRLNGLNTDENLEVIMKYLGQREGQEWSTLDSFVTTLREPIVVKMDVDGGEVDVLLGADSLLSLSRVRLLIETHSLELESQCKAILEGYGFVTKIIYNAWWRRLIKDQRPIGHNRWIIGYRPSERLL